MPTVSELRSQIQALAQQQEALRQANEQDLAQANQLLSRIESRRQQIAQIQQALEQTRQQLQAMS